jgi:FKBP-type peptidyl-prolyl cis-trans isomerase FklB
MKKMKFIAAIFIALLLIQACNSISYKTAKADNKADSASYMIGISVGYSLKMQNVPDVNASLIAKGIMEVMEKDSTVSMQDANLFLNAYFTELREKQAKENLEKGKEFLAANKLKPGVIETASGLQYKVIQEGTGKSPVETDRVKCHYRGRLITGEEFDSSYKRGMPAEFSLKGVIKGWTEGLQLMREGGKYELYLPPDLAYGTRGGGQIVGPNETLIFEIELLEVITPPAGK